MKNLILGVLICACFAAAIVIFIRNNSEPEPAYSPRAPDTTTPPAEPPVEPPVVATPGVTRSDALLLDVYVVGRLNLAITAANLSFTQPQADLPSHITLNGSAWSPTWDAPQGGMVTSERKPLPVDMTGWRVALTAATLQPGAEGYTDRYGFVVSREGGALKIHIDDFRKSGAYYRFRITPPTDPSTFDVPAEIEKGKQAMKEHRTGDANVIHTRLISMAPEDPRAFLARGQFYSQMRDHDKAVNNLTRAVAMEPDNVDFRIARSKHYTSWNDFAGAMPDLEHAVKIAPDNAKARIARGYGYSCIARHDLALTDFDIAVEKDPDNPTAHLERALGLFRVGQRERGMKDIDWVLEHHPKLPNGYFTRAYFNRMSGNFDQALADLTRTIELDPDFSNAYRERAFHFYGNKWSGHTDLHKAVEDYTEFIKRNPRSELAYSNRGLVHINMGDLDKAMADLNEALRLNSRALAALSNRARIYNQRGQFDLAIKDLTSFLQWNREYWAPYHDRGVAYLGLKQADPAIADFSKAIEISPDDWRSYAERARAYDLKDDKDKADADRRHADRLRAPEKRPKPREFDDNMI